MDGKVTYYAKSYGWRAIFSNDLLADIAMLIVGICYSTVIGIFQTLLYLKYKKELEEPVENAVPVQEQ